MIFYFHVPIIQIIEAILMLFIHQNKQVMNLVPNLDIFLDQLKLELYVAILQHNY